MTRLWDRGTQLDAVVERLTVGRDPELDLELVAHDALASAAHAAMLESIGVLDGDELKDLRRELETIAREARAGEFKIEMAEEDGHTAIENRLTAALGDAGRKIHTGRSRNDQVIAALRLWGREALLSLHGETLALAARLFELSERHRDTSMPGYSHTRQAMPTTFGHWMGAHGEGLLDNLPWLRRSFKHLNRSPLGSASGFGVSLPLDRQQVADTLAFDAVQGNTLAVQNDRGKSEWLALGAAVAVANDLGRLASDLIWLSSDELGIVRLPESLTTGSSIMPQKRNPDVLELVRAGAASLRARHAEVGAVYSQLTSGYHRDLQLTKGPFLEGLRHAADLARATKAVVDGLEVDAERARETVQSTTAATDALYERVAAGQPFRSAYREVATDPEAAVAGDPTETWKRRAYVGAPGGPRLGDEALREERQWLETVRERVAAVWARFAD